MDDQVGADREGLPRPDGRRGHRPANRRNDRDRRRRAVPDRQHHQDRRDDRGLAAGRGRPAADGHAVTLRDADKVGGAGVLRGLHEASSLTVADLIHLMIVLSDNTATNC